MDNWLTWINSNWKLLSLVGGLSFAGFVLWLKSKFATVEQHQALRDQVEQLAKNQGKRIGQVETRLGHIETRLEHMPSADDIRRLDRTLSGLSATMEGTKEQLNRLENKTDLLLENELRGE
ncbi:DUF2730 family protein [Ferrimonas sp.]|uniref:DUF2730 family protein n=1 Tax=Ferrimonas sp. TaxID=2080861 RepID=UPI003A8FE5CF